MIILNLGCGLKTSPDPSVLNIDYSILLKIRTNWLFRTVAPLFLDDDRLTRLRSLPDNVMLHDLSKGIPFGDESADVVYHSHLIEHLDRNIAPLFLKECFRVLKPGGIMRIVAPDLEIICRKYMANLELCEKGVREALDRHDDFFEELFLQSVQREAFGAGMQKPLRRFIENLFLGDARKRGQTHQWMYDRFNLEALLYGIGFGRVAVQSFDTSFVPEWNTLELDRDEHGAEYKPESLYIEAVKKEIRA